MFHAYLSQLGSDIFGCQPVPFLCLGASPSSFLLPSFPPSTCNVCALVGAFPSCTRQEAEQTHVQAEARSFTQLCANKELTVSFDSGFLAFPVVLELLCAPGASRFTSQTETYAGPGWGRSWAQGAVAKFDSSWIRLGQV